MVMVLLFLVAMTMLMLALRFALEMAALIAFGYWGYTAHGGPVMRIGFAVLAPMTVALFWGTFVAPKAALSLQPWLKQALALVVFALASSTLAARGISGLSEMLKHYEAHAPLRRNVLPDELGATGTFLASDGAAAITGQVLYVDCGYQIMGM